MFLALLACCFPEGSTNPRDNFDRPELIRISVEGGVPPGTEADEALHRMEGLGYACDTRQRGCCLENCPGNLGPTSTAPDSVGACGIIVGPHVWCAQRHGPVGWSGTQEVEVYLALGDAGVEDVLVMAWYESPFTL